MIKVLFTSICLLTSLEFSAHASNDMPEWEKDLYRNRTSSFTPQQTYDIIQSWGLGPSGSRPESGWIPGSDTQSSSSSNPYTSNSSNTSNSKK